MPVLIISILRTETGRAALYILGLVFILPALFSYINLYFSLRSSNLCFVGPGPSVIRRQRSGFKYRYDEKRFHKDDNINPINEASLQALYGTYRTLDGSNYYMVKSPFDTHPFCLFSSFEKKPEIGLEDDKYSKGLCGWPSSTTLSNMISPHTISEKRKQWRRDMYHKIAYYFSVGTNTNHQHSIMSHDYTFSSVLNPQTQIKDTLAASISWDQSFPANPSQVMKGKNRWCLILDKLIGDEHSERRAQICTDPQIAIIPNVNPEIAKYHAIPMSPPPNGSWGNDGLVQVQCFMGNWDNDQDNNFDNPALNMISNVYNERLGNIVKKIKWNPFKIPCTMMLIILQIIYYVKYKKRDANEPTEYILRTAVSYETIVEQGEYWRIYSSVFSHLDVTHLAYDIYNLYVIGAVLEQDYGSIPFLYLNLVSVVMITVMVLICIKLYAEYCSRRQVQSSDDFGPDALKSSNVIFGYSSVVFAWITVGIIERTDYPILPFGFTSISTTNSDGWAVLLLIQVVLCRIVSPQASSILSIFTGLLTGILIHFNIPEKNMWLAPHVFLPLWLLADLCFVRKIIPMSRFMKKQEQYRQERYELVERTDDKENSGDLFPKANESTNNETSENTIKQQKKHLGLSILNVIRNLMIVSSFFGIFAMDHATAVAQCLICVLFHHAVKIYELKLNDDLADHTSENYEPSDVTDVVMRG